MWTRLLVIGCMAASALGQDWDCGRRTEHSRAKRIVGGHKAGHWPWMAALYTVTNGRTVQFCGATVIGERWLLTAQHCVDRPYGNNTSNMQFAIAFGTTYNIQARRAKIIRRPKSVTMYKDFAPQHPRSYAAKVLGQDIAIIELDEPLVFSKDVQPICLRDVDDVFRYRNTSMKAIGYGRSTPWKMNDTDYRFPARLQELDITVEQPVECARILYTAFMSLDSQDMSEIARLMALQFPTTNLKQLLASLMPLLQLEMERDTICAMPRGEVKGVCGGDSGSPLMKQEADGRWYLYGVTARSSGECGGSTSASFFVDVTRQCEFIIEVTDGDVDCGGEESD